MEHELYILLMENLNVNKENNEILKTLYAELQKAEEKANKNNAEVKK